MPLEAGFEGLQPGFTSILSSYLLNAIEMWCLSFLLLPPSCAFPTMTNFLLLWNSHLLVLLLVTVFLIIATEYKQSVSESDKVLPV